MDIVVTILWDCLKVFKYDLINSSIAVIGIRFVGLFVVPTIMLTVIEPCLVGVFSNSVPVDSMIESCWHENLNGGPGPLWLEIRERILTIDLKHSISSWKKRMFIVTVSSLDQFKPVYNNMFSRLEVAARYIWMIILKKITKKIVSPLGNLTDIRTTSHGWIVLSFSVLKCSLMFGLHAIWS